MTQDTLEKASPDAGSAAGRFGALSNPRFRFYWLSMFASFLGTQMQLVAQGWLVLELTNSPLWLGLAGGAAGLPVLAFSLFGGAVADRVERRKLLIICQLAISGLKLALTVLVLTGQVRVWHIMVVSVGLGVAMAFNDPARQAFVTELVKKEEFLNAISLSAMAMNITRIGGPMFAGAVIGAIGLGPAYVVNTAVGVLAAVMLLPIPSSKVGPEARKFTVWSNVAEGLSFARNNKIILWLLAVAGLPTIFGPMANALVPVFARDVLDVGAIGLGQLMGAVGVGALVGSIVIASAGNVRRKGIIFACSGMLHNAASFTFALSTSFPFSIIVLAIQGMAASGWSSMITTLIQTHTPNELRGRVMSLYLIAMQSAVLSQVLAGAIASATGAPFAAALGGAIAFVLNFSSLVVTSRIRRLD